MELYTRIVNLKDRLPNAVVALGTFDGLHRGHQRIIGGAAEWARRLGGSSIVFTFSNHPLSVIAPGQSPLLIYPNEIKAKLIKTMGIDALLNIPFTTKLLHLSPNDFISVLYDNLRPAKVIVGPNYSFGYKGKGTPEMLRAAGRELGFAVDIHPAVELDGVIVSSTIIRQMLCQGNVRDAAFYLGRPFALYGMTVISGQRRGRQLGYPTANLAIPSGFVVPGDGVYAVNIRYGNTEYEGVANIGSNPTFAENKRRIEVHLLNFSQDIYQQPLDIIFYERLRGERCFKSADALKRQIADDIEAARQIFRTTQSY
ncbi:MAG: bifunctional riboflavin kinase/FAD synthetase [Negativicutes bacterium]|nr:bifunctional riboflavin kinase/FAD synthetase [Negativicutes bacterium]